MTCAEKYVCPYCGAKGYLNVRDIVDIYFSPSDNSIWQLVICDECGGSYQISFELNPESVQIEPNQPGEEGKF